MASPHIPTLPVAVVQVNQRLGLRLRPAGGLELVGNDPSKLCGVSCWNRCQLKAVAAASAAFTSLLVVCHWQAMMALYQAPIEAGLYNVSNAPGALGRFPRVTFNGSSADWQSTAAAPAWISWTTLAASLSVYLFGVIPWYFVLGNTWLRWSTCVTAALGSTGLILVLVPILFAVQLSGTSISNADVVTWVGGSVGALVPVFLTQGAAATTVRWPAGQQALMLLVGVVGVLGIANNVAPWFATAPVSSQLAFRLVGFPIAAEGIGSALRLFSRSGSAPSVPHDRAIMFASGFMAGIAMIGRFFTSTVASAQGSIAIAFSVALLEVVLRVTQPARDHICRVNCRPLCRTLPCTWGRQCCLDPTRGATAADHRAALEAAVYGPGQGGKLSSHDEELLAQVPLGHAASGNQRLHAHYSFLTLDTMVEDSGIIVAAAMGLTMRLPLRMGDQPLSNDAVLFRTAVQYALELVIDFGPVLGSLCLSKLLCTRLPVLGDQQLRQARLPGDTAPSPGGSAVFTVTSTSCDPEEGGLARTATPSPRCGRGGGSLPSIAAPSILDDTPGGETGSPWIQPTFPARLSTDCGCVAPPGVCGCVLQAGESDVRRAEAERVRGYLRELIATSADAVWVPTSMESLVVSSVASGEAVVLGAALPADAQPSLLQQGLLWLGASLEVTSVRLNRAWGTRNPSFTPAFTVGLMGTVTLLVRIMAGPALRCLKEDAFGEPYFDQCLPADIPLTRE